ncbi:Uncharacterised protein [uncultured archaeon]|nr:Uncharacterised protein [uncultured archaeon]
MSYQKVVMWGFHPQHQYDTYSHILEGFYRAYKHMGKEVEWLDRQSNIEGRKFENTLFISEHQVANTMPLHSSNFYAVHNMFGGKKETLDHLNGMNVLHYGVYTMNHYKDHGEVRWLDQFSPFYPEKRVIEILWATDLLPHEIEANKAQAKVFNASSREINWVGSGRRTLDAFGRAVREAGMQFNVRGSFGGPVSIEDNVLQIQRSRFSPVMVDDYQMTHPYIPCRLFKNISYGVFPVTNSKCVHDYMGKATVFEENGYNLFHKAERELPGKNIHELYGMMDMVGRLHTYINRAQVMLEAAEYYG